MYLKQIKCYTYDKIDSNCATSPNKKHHKFYTVEEKTRVLPIAPKSKKLSSSRYLKENEKLDI